MIKILFICHGNICRSPMAEFLMKEMVKNVQMSDVVQIASAAVSTEELGNPVYPPVRRLLAAEGIDCSGKTARQMTRADYDAYDLLVAMDTSNLRQIHRICGGDPLGKVSRLLDWTKCPRDVADPWYTGDFETCRKDVAEGCEALLEHLKKSKNADR